LKEETLALREQAVALREQAAVRAVPAAATVSAVPPEPSAISAAAPPLPPIPQRSNDGTYACGSVRCGDLQRCCEGASVPCIPKEQFCGDDSQNMWGDTCDLRTNEPCRSGKTCKPVKQGHGPLTISATCM
jgi:hypothetical protein